MVGLLSSRLQFFNDCRLIRILDRAHKLFVDIQLVLRFLLIVLNAETLHFELIFHLLHLECLRSNFHDQVVFASEAVLMVH